jgi:hypothetical protein
MLRRFELRLAAIARRSGLSILLVSLAPLVLRAFLLPWIPIPSPRVQDEFSHLLVADTFAHGHLVNPVHPLWVHFESMHILARPVYASVFPIAQGLVMALGQALTGNPWIGVWMSIGLMCAAICWMLQGWVPPGWALLGGSLAAIRFGMFSYWMNSYFGGAMAAMGGALVLGALPRIVRRRRWRDAVIMGIGLVVLANSRPYEGLLYSLPVVAALAWLLWNKARVFVVLLPLIAIVSLSAIGMAYYFARFSGNPLLLPYTFYRNTVTMAPHFIWQSPRPEPVYNHRVLHDFYTGWEMRSYSYARDNRRPYDVYSKIKSYWRFYLGPFLTIPFLTLPWLWRRLRIRLLLLAAILFCGGLLVEVWWAPHYAAPALGLAILLAIEALRQLRQTAGAFAVRAVALACILSPVIGGFGEIDGAPRAGVLKQLESMGGRHLVLVRYRLDHNVGNEWVYNSADIDEAPVVWAREMDPTSNRKLLRYFQDRKVWLVQPDATPAALSPYDISQPPDPPFRFVPLGTEAIEVLRSPGEVKQKILSRIRDEYTEPYYFSCDQWSYIFTAVTGIGGPDLAKGCFPSGQRGQVVSFDQWFEWLEKQR